jgi:lipid-binding SYLF domain-containing protein
VAIARNLSIVLVAMMLPMVQAWADEYEDTIGIFRNAVESQGFFNHAYGYAVFPNIAKAGFVVGGAYGKGRVYQHGRYIGDTTVTQLSAGLLAGGKVFSQMIFFEDERALKEFTSGNFEFGGEVSGVVITAAADAKATTTGASAGASGGQRDAKTKGKYYKGSAVFTVAKGGLMGELSLSGQKFSYTPKI